jgi:ubiquinone/menaquinone biosynthesis C-methylase UbiE
VPTSPYDPMALQYDFHRALPYGVPEAIRATVLGALCATHPRLLDLGAGTGRIGRPFVAAGDDYIGIDLSLGMLREFRRHAQAGPTPVLVQGDGKRLPFREGTFDAVLLVQIVGALQDWRRVVEEAQRVLRPGGALVLGHTVFPHDGIDARMKQHLASRLAELGVPSYHIETRGVAQPWLEAEARAHARTVVAEWSAVRTPRSFLDRQPTGARFSALPVPVQQAALRQLTAWAKETFDSLDTVFAERHAFELQIFRFQERVAACGT